MGKTKIEWADRVWNPITGCNKVSQGCKNCYAERIANRFWGDRKFTDVICHEDRLRDPLKWRKPSMIFVNSMSDLFHEKVPFEFIKQVFHIMSLAEQHTFLVLTKRPERMLEYFKWDGFGSVSYAWPNWIWLGVSVEDQKAADSRIPLLLQSPAKVKFLSCEPLLGPIMFKIDWLPVLIGDGPEKFPGIDWVIAGGESGPNARPMHPQWPRYLRDRCQEADVPFFFKQWGEWAPPEDDCFGPNECGPLDGSCTDMRQIFSFPDGKIMTRSGKGLAGRLLDGRKWNEYPE